MRREVSAPRTTRLVIGRAAPGPFTDGVITLRTPEPSDIGSLIAYGSDEALTEGIWIRGPQPGETVDAWATSYLDDWRAGWTDAGGMEGAVLLADERDPFVGIVNFVPREADVVELLYGVAPPVRGRGIATRMARLASDWALGDGGFARVELRIGERHAASRRVAERAGFRFAERYETHVTGTGQTHIDTLYLRTAE